VVRLHVLITKTGELRQIEVVEGDPRLVPYALDAVKQWQYGPCLINSVPIEVNTEVDIHFTLNQ
jgi:hypothetical protein